MQTLNNYKNGFIFRMLAAALYLLWPLTSLAQSTPTYEVKQGKFEFVIPHFAGVYSQREASIAPEEYEAAERLRTMLENNQRKEVLAELDKFYDLELSPAMLTLKAQVYFSLKIYDKAEATYLAVLKRAPQLVRAHSDLAQVYLFKEDYKNARKYFANAIAFGSNEAIIHGQLAYLNLSMFGPYSAISEYQQAMALEPENPQWQQGLLAALSQARMYDAAEALVQEILSKRPEEPSLWLNKAGLALQRGDIQQATASIEMAILLGDKDPRNLKTAAQLHLQLNSYDRALSLLDQQLSTEVFDMTSINEYMAWLGQFGMWSKASQLLDVAAKNMTKMSYLDQSYYYLHRAKIAVHRQAVTEAIKFYRQSLDKNPSNGDALLSFAEFSNSQKDYVDAELLYIRAEAISGSEKDALLGRAQLYIDMQDYPSALNQLRNTYQKFPEMTNLKDNIDIIENIIRAKETSNT